jgi:3-oxoacyl-[acyl-carrier-protein] synthase III
MLRQVGEACLQRSARPREEIDLVLHSGVYRSDFIGEPAIASIAAGELGINHDDKLLGEHRTLAFDILNGSGGTLTACFLAGELIGRAFSRALVLASEVEYEREHSSGRSDRRMETASALVLEESSGSEGFAAFAFRSFPEHIEAIVSATGVDDNRCAIFHEREAALEDREVECATSVVRELLARQGLSVDQVWLAPPQRPGKLAARLAETLGIDSRRVLSLPAERDYYTSSLACTFEKARQQELKAGTPIVFVEVTAGLQVWCGVYHVGERGV